MGQRPARRSRAVHKGGPRTAPAQNLLERSRPLSRAFACLLVLFLCFAGSPAIPSPPRSAIEDSGPSGSTSPGVNPTGRNLSEKTLTVNAAIVFPQASSIKITVLMELLRQAQAGRLKLDDRVAIKQVQMVGGSGVLQFFGDASSAISLRDLAVLMIVLSDNTATNILIDQVRMANVNDTLAHLGLAQTRLQRRMIDTAAQRAGRENLSTPREMTDRKR